MLKITHRRILSIAVPIVLSNVTVPLLGAVDTGVIGQLGDAAAIGAVGIGAILIGAIYWLFGFLRMGTTGLAAQAVGRGDMAEFTALLWRAMVISVLGGGAIIALQPWIIDLSFWVSPASSEVETMARDYMQIRIFSAPAAIALYGLTGWLIAQERTRAVFAIQFAMNGLNIVLDLWFVLGIHWGVAGVAYASLIAEYSGVLIALWFCRAALLGTQPAVSARIWQGSAWRKLFLVNRDILLRSLMLQVIFVSFLLIGARFDDTTLAANQVLMQFISITAYGLDGFAFAVETLVGQSFGRRNRDMLRQSIIKTGFWAVGLGLALAVGFLLAGPWVIALMAKDPAVQDTARTFLIYMALTPLFGVAPFLLDGIFVGAARARDMRDMMAISLLIYVVTAWALIGWIENHGLWISLLISYAARGATLAARYPALERDLG